ncbi:hypothetical protein Pmani_012883 [Petrolisthes manimaculis]|uniref:C2 domain-containing protein n=1 Tax=Petrolisthes manimaculis TaxID=1843537 RepID=A0AAE1PZK8_9EUCA|nr:hypothetical protein Pmani_012883 [Petrolisthes manimaculis]
MKDQDVESQTGGSVVRFIPAAPDTQAGRRGSSLDYGGRGDGWPQERSRPGRIRKKLAGQSMFRFEEPPQTTEPEVGDPKARWQKVTTEPRAVSRIESEEFFTHVWPEERYPVAPTPIPGPSTQPTPASPGFMPEKSDIKTPSKKAAQRDDIDLEEEITGESESERAALVDAGGTDAATSLVSAHYLPLHQRQAADSSTLFLPSALPSDVQSKVEGEKEVLRDPEEEGLFVGEKPYLTRTNLNIIENQLLKQRNRQWFTETGSVERLDIPTSDRLHHHRPPLDPDPSTPLTVFVPPQTREQLLEEGSGCEEATGILDLELCRLTFHHHPLFSPEHVLTARLLAAHTTYTQRMEVGVARVLQNKLQVLRQAKAKLVRRAEKSGSSGQKDKSIQAEIDRTRRLEIYREEILECREEARVEAERDRELLTTILKTWNEVKQVRRASRFHTTPYKLLIHRLETDRAQEEEQRKVELEAEVREVLEEREEEYTAKRKVYEEELKEWKEAHRKMKEAKKRQVERRRSSCSEVSVVQTAQDEATLATPELPKPHPPPAIHKHKVELEVLDGFSRSHKPPGEPLITKLELTQLGNNSTPTITPTNTCPDTEKKRRQTVAKTKVFVRILINNKLVTQTSAAHLDGATFTANLGQTYRMALSSWPRSVALEVCEAGPGLRRATLATALLPIPEPHITIASREEPEVVEFSSSQVVGISSGGVGCGQAGSEYGHELISGRMMYRLGWAAGRDASTPLAPPTPSPSQLIHAKCESRLDPACDPKSAQRWLDSSRLDPNDPTNALLISRLKRVAAGKITTPKYLELDWNEGDFCSDRELMEGVRLRVLQLRAQGAPGFRALRMVPAAESEVLRKTLENYDNKASSEETPGATEGDGLEAGGGEWWGQLEARRDRAERLLSSLRLRLHLRQADPSTAPPCLEDLVKEESIPDINTLGTNLLGVFRARRPLKPPRRKRDRVRGAALTNQPVRLLVYIARAFHLPTRTPHDTEEGGIVEWGGQEGEGGEVRPYVEGSFQRTITRTSVAHGPNPTWNQQLSFPFKAPNDNFSAGSLQTVPDSLHLHLYDQTTSDLLTDDRLRTSTVHARVERRWLGSLHIPFSTIYANAKIEGTFALEEPAVLLGYNREGEAGHHTASSPSHHQRLHPPSHVHTHPPTTHLSLYITLEPTLPPPEPVQAHFDSNEPEETLEAGQAFVSSLSTRHKTRHYRTHALDLSGKQVALNRFIRPLQPPQELTSEDEEETKHRVAWYVSLIPTLTHTSLLPGPAHIWANSEQFLSLLTGGEEERAVLLTNFFLHLDKTAYLLLGSGVAEGGSCCVVTKDSRTGEWQVWNPPTARCYSPHHPHPPLTAIHMLIDQDNIYANVQKYDDPPRVNLDVGSGGWRAFYPKSPNGVPQPGLPSVQPRELSLTPPDPDGAGRLRERLEIVLRDAIMKWRPDRRTVWNRHAISVLRGLVGSLEEGRAAGHHISPDLSKMASLMASHKVCGVCVQQGYSGTPGLVEAVHSTGIHLTHHPDAEFALAVHIVPYPAALASIWIYVASLIKRT